MWRQERSPAGFIPCLLALLVAAGAITAHAQIDPVKRRIVQAGYSLPLVEHGPLAAYGFYYYNEPNFKRTNVTLRMAVVPVYLDSEIGFSHALGPHTDFGIGVSGGGFADSYNEIRMGDYITGESFTGHAAEVNGVAYHLFNPADRAPLYGILRLGGHGSFFEADSDTDNNFEVPDDQAMGYARVGLRLGGREPYLTPDLAGELSLWHETQFRGNHTYYGFNNDRKIEDFTHLFWGRALLAYTFPKSQHYLETSLTAGASIQPDRFSAYRLGGTLNLISEFPMTLPGYFTQEISAANVVQLSTQYIFPLDPAKRFAVSTGFSVAVVDYLDGLEQPGHIHSGVGGGLFYRSPSRAWTVGVGYAYGIEAIRGDGRGGQSITFQLQYDMDAERRAGDEPFWDPLKSVDTWRGLLRVLTGKQ